MRFSCSEWLLSCNGWSKTLQRTTTLRVLVLDHQQVVGSSSSSLSPTTASPISVTNSSSATADLLPAVDSVFTMKNDYAHHTSQKPGDHIAVTSDRHLQIINAVDQHQCSDFIIDVKVCAMVTGDEDWKA